MLLLQKNKTKQKTTTKTEKRNDPIVAVPISRSFHTAVVWNDCALRNVQCAIVF